MVLPNLEEQYLKKKERGDINDAWRSIRFVILEWYHCCHQDWCNLTENNSDFLCVYVGGLWVSSETTRDTRIPLFVEELFVFISNCNSEKFLNAWPQEDNTCNIF